MHTCILVHCTYLRYKHSQYTEHYCTLTGLLLSGRNEFWPPRLPQRNLSEPTYGYSTERLQVMWRRQILWWWEFTCAYRFVSTQTTAWEKFLSGLQELFFILNF